MFVSFDVPETFRLDWKKKDRKRIFSHCIELNWSQLHDYSAVHNLQYVENLKKLFVKSQILFSLDLEFRLLESIEKRRIGNDLLHDCITGQLHQTRFCNSFWKFVKTYLVALPYIAKADFFSFEFSRVFLRALLNWTKYENSENFFCENDVC